MMGVSNKLYILVEALLYIAHNAGVQPLGGKKLAGILNVAPRYLEPLLQTLVRADILRSVRGPRGGYMLAKEAELIRMDDVLSALEHGRDDKHVPNFSQANEILVQPVFSKAKNAYFEALGTTTLDDLCDDAKEKGLGDVFIFGKETNTRLDYTI